MLQGDYNEGDSFQELGDDTEYVPQTKPKSSSKDKKKREKKKKDKGNADDDVRTHQLLYKYKHCWFVNVAYNIFKAYCRAECRTKIKEKQ